MTRITANEINDTMEEIPSKLLLVINAIDKGNAETHQLLRTLIEEVQTSERKQNNTVEQVLQTISNNSAGISTAIQEGFQGVENRNLLYIIICSTCGEEYTGETAVGKTKLRDRVRVYRQHIR